MAAGTGCRLASCPAGLAVPCNALRLADGRADVLAQDMPGVTSIANIQSVFRKYCFI